MSRLAARAGLPTLALLAASALAAPAEAQSDSQQCRIECAAPFAERAQNTISIQTCLVRCAARSAALGAANVTGTMVMPTPLTPWTAPPGTRRPPQGLAAAPRGTERQANARQRSPAKRNPGANLASAQLAPASTPASPAAPSVFGSFIADQAAVPAAVPEAAIPAPRAPDSGRGTFGAIYAARTPSRAYGLSVGAGDRGVAHRAAESACHEGKGNACRLVGEFSARCGAVAHALRSNGAVVVTAHSSTYTVMAAVSGTGQTREEAERQAMAACAQRGRGLLCQVTEARCAG
ncbi:DUF4189 domain-containing protein [Muricoccus roseus]|uniref:DUF4189 domain-containing protein n=1 Tax=Muricoccus roseus TaxID=198092 RepID=UPI0009349573|nr:DUF4189 domain-containing protein [Roseomonas rosea]